MSESPSMNDENPSRPTTPEGGENLDEVVGAEDFAAGIQDAVANEEAISVEAELATEKDRVMRLQAEMENLRSRTSREINEERRYAALPVVRDLLPVIDNVDRAIEVAEQSAEAASLLEGFKLVRQQLVTVLEQHQCKKIADVGEPFDPQFHEAILQQPSDDQPANHIMMATETGYVLHDRVVRPSKVIVSSGPAEGE